MKQNNLPINRLNYEEFFLLYVDGELDAQQRVEVEKFASEDPQLRTELDLLLSTVIGSDDDVVFDKKELLYREESDRKGIIWFNWKTMAAAAAILLFLGATGWIFLGNRGSDQAHRQDMARRTEDPLQPNSQPPAKQQADRDSGIARKNIAKETKPEVEGDRQATGLRDLADQRQKNRKKNISSPDTRTNKPVTRDLVKDNDLPLKKSGKKQDEVVTEPDDNNSNQDHQPMEKAAPFSDMAKVDRHTDDVAIPVAARRLPQGASSQPMQIRYADETESDRNTVYIANASFSKRNSLRGVFRKASRIFDRITSIQ